MSYFEQRPCASRQRKLRGEQNHISGQNSREHDDATYLVCQVSIADEEEAKMTPEETAVTVVDDEEELGSDKFNTSVDFVDEVSAGRP